MEMKEFDANAIMSMASTSKETLDIVDSITKNVDTEEEVVPYSSIEGDEYIKKEDLDDPDKRKSFVKHLNPEVKANMVYQALLRQGMHELYGKDKRRYIRKLQREAEKGRLDKYFL